MAACKTPARLTLLGRVICPHCWHQFAPEDALWVGEHPDLIGDPKLGDMHAVRFLPSRFSPEGDAIDPEGYRTTQLACPNHFRVALNDADASANARLHQYEEQQFLNADPDQLVSIAKTETQGDLYDQVNMGDHSMTFPRPFMFNLQPMGEHPNHRRSKGVSRVICLYDNAGESFLPGADTVSSPVTRHLAFSACLFFCFDPTQDPRFRRACEGKFLKLAADLWNRDRLDHQIKEMLLQHLLAGACEGSDWLSRGLKEPLLLLKNRGVAEGTWFAARPFDTALPPAVQQEVGPKLGGLYRSRPQTASASISVGLLTYSWIGVMERDLDGRMTVQLRPELLRKTRTADGRLAVVRPPSVPAGLVDWVPVGSFQEDSATLTEGRDEWIAGRPVFYYPE